MTREDLRIFCTALGFTAVVRDGGEGTVNDADRAVKFANLIETFCLHTVPDLTADQIACEAHTDKMIEDMKAALCGKGEASMNKDRATLIILYHRLLQRYQSYASDNMVADRVLELLDAEIDHKYIGSGPD